MAWKFNSPEMYYTCGNTPADTYPSPSSINLSMSHVLSVSVCLPAVTLIIDKQLVHPLVCAEAVSPVNVSDFRKL